MRDSAAPAVDVKTEFSLGIFVAEIHFPRRSFNALGRNDKVMDQFLHTHQDAFLFWKEPLGFCDVDRTSGDAGKGLDEDFVALAQFFQTNQIAVITIAHGTEGDIEIKGLVSKIGVSFPQIVVHPGGTEVRPGESVGEGPVRLDNAHVPGPIQEDLVAGE